MAKAGKYLLIFYHIHVIDVICYIFFSLIFNFFFKILAINGTETLGGCPQLVTELSRVCP